ncbi:TIGR00341 family protein [Hirschia maritima]|uniref:TIGR00341 family protein n=1 Tax=Hirschia maritima TaxID=1121961 RepID=UPI000372CEAF|nr:TIGR00341 family protein [Hirschia maritima]
MKNIKLTYPASYRKRVEVAIKQADPIDWSREEEPEKERETVHVLLEDGEGQSLMDSAQNMFSTKDKWRLSLFDVEATLPRNEKPEPEKSDEKPKSPKQAMRETLVEEVMSGSKLTTDFIVLTILSAIVAAIGLNENNVAVVIGAMVIAPLLGPILGFSLSSALGSGKMMVQSARTAVTGLCIGFGTVFVLAMIFPINLQSEELIARTNINPEVIALALASGAAAALSLTGGLSSSLVGVMVAVALLPPSAASAMYLGAGDLKNAIAAAVLVLLNVVCVLLSTQIVFVWKGVQPRRWSQQENAEKSRRNNIVSWIVLLVLLFTIGLMISSGEGTAASSAHKVL